MRVCMYLRKSRADVEAEARGEGETLARHKAELLRLARRGKYDLGEIYEEVCSGDTIAARPQMQRLMADVGAGKWDGVLVMEVERLARGDTLDQGLVAQAFKFTGTLIITPKKVYDPNNEFDEEYFEFSLFMSRREFNTIKRRLSAGREAAAREGKFPGNSPPYGYRRIKLAHTGGYTLETIPEEAETVRRIFSWYTEGYMGREEAVSGLGLSAICRKLNALGVAPRRSGAWAPATIRDMLKNPVYIGKIRWNWRKTEKRYVDSRYESFRPRHPDEACILSKGLHDAIISDAVFAQAQEKLRAGGHAPLPRALPMQNPLCGLILCGKCGRRMVRRPYSNGRQPSLICPCSACDNVSSYLGAVEGRLLDALEIWLGKYRLSVSAAADIDTALEEDTLKRASDALAACTARRQSLYELLERGVYSDAVFLERSRALEDEVSALQKSLADIERALQYKRDVMAAQARLTPRTAPVTELYRSAPDAQTKNALLREALDKVVYRKEAQARHKGDPYGFSLTLYPKLPRV